MVFLTGCKKDKNINNYKSPKNEFVKDTIISNIKLTFIPKGFFKYGIDCNENLINYDYWIGKYEITNLDFYTFINNALMDSFIFLENNILKYNFPGNDVIPKGSYRVKMFDDRIFLKNNKITLKRETELHPVISVTWFGAKAFCDYYKFQLPTEWEWEKAARGNNCIRFPWGNEIDSTYANYFGSNDPFEPGTTPIGFYNGEIQNGFPTHKSESVYGCFDMAGNAWEWTNDIYDKRVPFYKGKGGCFNYHKATFLQIYYVSLYGPEIKPPLDMCDLADGFRVVKK